MLSYKGLDQRSRPVTGVPTDEYTPAALAKSLYDRGYRQLTIYDRNEIVGAIEKNPDTGRRVWWGKDTTTRQSHKPA